MDEDVGRTDAAEGKSSTVIVRRPLQLRAMHAVNADDVVADSRRVVRSDDVDVMGPVGHRSPSARDVVASRSASSVASSETDVVRYDGDVVAAGAADPVAAALASFSPLVALGLSPMPSKLSVTPSVFSSLDVSFTEEMAVSTLVDLCSVNVESVDCIQSSSVPTLDWTEFARRMLDNPREDWSYYDQMLRDVVGAEDLSARCRGVVLDACLALVREARARHSCPTIDVPAAVPVPDKPDVIDLRQHMHVLSSVL